METLLKAQNFKELSVQEKEMRKALLTALEDNKEVTVCPGA